MTKANRYVDRTNKMIRMKEKHEIIGRIEMQLYRKIYLFRKA